ncbi:hypothetical protein JNUCC1_00650 [Lentibacillus sp. JNUCC-1]|uniref:STAS/SEC14 domain-containing protein n=1 Tax=Lentibacillus sp. JNUCC-1 TaxID=2654513 RepID=UPI0012E73387|nr:STAS/SEC14 domain-containing protein [Lentibacillus sp. JNUCC-1]MUV36846.1 hypothetical protein [Lentibacillus sp. JNUCC-1]
MMVEIANIENSPVVEMKVSDKLTQDDIKEVDNFLENKVGEQESVNILLLMGNWEGMTIKGLLEDFKMVKHMKKMNKAAIVADSTFLKADSKLEDLFPGIRIKYFETDEKDAAKQWLEE